MYTDVFAYAADDPSALLFQIVTGILQGCPLSGSLFVIVINPLLVALSKKFPCRSRAEITACADDVGLALKSLIDAPLVAQEFEFFAKIARLCLKPAKCVIVPAATCNLAAFVRQAKDLLEDICPQWAHFTFKDCNTYLGWLLGPGATAEMQWETAIATLSFRTEQIACSAVPGAIGAKLWSQRAVPVLSYLPNFGEPPEALRLLEVRAIHRLLHLPSNS